MKLFFGEIFPEVALHEEEQQHILKVLRMKDGDAIAITDGKGNVAEGILKFEGKKVKLTDYLLSLNEAPFSPRLHIGIAPTKNMDRIEFFVEKATEMGISEITFLHTEKTERKNINVEKIRKQAVSASKQSLRFHFPKINDIVKLSEFIKRKPSDQTFVAHCHENLERTSLGNIVANNEIGELLFLIGPEGDFSEKEIKMLAEKGIKAVSLGDQRLRTETAGIFVAAWNYFQSFNR